MLYIDLCNIYEQLEKTTKRLEKTSILSKFLKSIPLEDLDKIIYLLQGHVFPERDERKTGMSSKLIVKVIATASGSSVNSVTKSWRKLGDLGLVAEQLIKEKKQSTLHHEKLTIKKVFNNIQTLSTLEGKGTFSKKIGLISELLTSSSPKEAKFIVRTVLEELRVGVASGILRDSIASAFDKDVDNVEESFNILTDYGEVAKRAKQNQLNKIELKPGKPINVMLAVPVKDTEEAFEALGKPAQFEYKLDGFRLEIHKNHDFKLFTRRLEDATRQFPDVIDYIKKHVKGKNFILDAEIVSVDKKSGKYLPFQSISQRIKRKYDIEEMAKKFPIEINVFDVVYYNGRDLFNQSLLERRKLLERIVKQESGKIVLTKKLITDNEKEANKFFNQALNAGTEGLMIKNIRSNYKPGRYVNGWVKLKSVLDPLDLVIIKAEWGEGKRAEWLSSYTIACQDNGRLLEIGKVSTGIKEKETELTYESMTKLLKPLITNQKGKEVTVKPKLIIEVAYEEIQKSPTSSSGFSLRFPRILRLKIDEKTLRDISDLNYVKKIYNSQKK